MNAPNLPLEGFYAALSELMLSLEQEGPLTGGEVTSALTEAAIAEDAAAID